VNELETFLKFKEYINLNKINLSENELASAERFFLAGYFAGYQELLKDQWAEWNQK
jgi:hypothetical protein